MDENPVNDEQIEQNAVVEDEPMEASSTMVQTEESAEIEAVLNETDLPKESEKLESVQSMIEETILDILPEKEDSKNTDDNSVLNQLEQPITVVTDSIPRPPSNPKSHPALPRPPIQSNQRPIFHIIAPRGTTSNSDPRIILPRGQAPTRLRQFVPKQESVRPARLKFEPRQPRATYVRIDKAVTRPRKVAPTTVTTTATPVVNILQATTTKMAVKPKSVNLHHIPTVTAKVPRPTSASSAPPPIAPGPSISVGIPVVRLPKSSTPQPKKQKTVAFAVDEAETKLEKVIPGSASVSEGENFDGQPPEREHRQREAIEYLEEVKQKFDAATYSTFLDVMKGFKRQDMDTIGVIRRVCYLFAAEPSLIAGFNGFLPQGYAIILSGSVITIKDRDGRHHSVDVLADPNKLTLNVPPAPEPSAVMEEFAPKTFDNAVSFLQALKSRVSKKNYERFLQIIKGCEGKAQLDPASGKKMFQEVAKVLENDEDLLLSFSTFLPEMHHWCVSEFVKKHNYEVKITNKDYYWQTENTMRKIADSGGVIKSKFLRYEPLKSRPVKNLLQVLKVSKTDDFVFFNKLREMIDNDRIFDNFCRILRIYTNGLIDRHELLASCMPFFRGNPFFQAEFKKMLGFKENMIFDPRNDPRHSHVDLEMKNDLDFSTLKRNGKSYRLLPEKYRHPKCSGRTELCYEVLNDDWAIYPSWQCEETTRVSFKKSPFEEFLHRTEDERFEIDMLVQINTEAMTALERIKRLSIGNPKYCVDDKFECTSKTLMQRAIRRAYGENTQRVLNALKKNPYLVSTTVLNRLKIKQREWKNMENAFKLVWEDQAKKYYQKMTARKVNHMKSKDNKLLKGNYILSRIQKRFKKKTYRLLKHGLRNNEQRDRISVSCRIQWPVLYDLHEIMLAFAKRHSNISNEDKKQMKRFLNKVMPMVLNYARPTTSDDEDPEEFPFLSMSPRIFYCGDAFVHFIHLYQVVASRLSKYFLLSKRLAKEEAYKFEMIKLRQEVFRQYEQTIPKIKDLDVIDGFTAIAPPKAKSMDRYVQYLSNLLALLEGKIPVSYFEEQTRRIYDENSYSALGLDKFITTLVKLLQSVVSDFNQMHLVNHIWKYNIASTEPETTKSKEYILHEAHKWLAHENIYEVAVYNRKRENSNFMTIRMVAYAAPYALKPDGFTSHDWKVYRRSYRIGVNFIKRDKRSRNRFKSRPLFLLRNMKDGMDRMGRHDHLKDDEYDSVDELIEETEDSDESASTTSTSSEEMDYIIPKSGLINDWPYGNDEIVEDDKITKEKISGESSESYESEMEKEDEVMVRNDKEYEVIQEPVAVQCGKPNVQKLTTLPPKSTFMMKKPENVESEDESDSEESEKDESNQEEDSSILEETADISSEADSENETDEEEDEEETMQKRSSKNTNTGESSSAGPSSRMIKKNDEPKILSELECRRRINKFTNIQDYKLLKLEFRTVRIEPVSDSEHDYEDDVIITQGASHMAADLADRIWWGKMLKRKMPRSGNLANIPEDSAEMYKRKKLTIQKQKLIKQKETVARRRGSSAFRITTIRERSKSKKSSKSSSSPGIQLESDPLAELMQPASFMDDSEPTSEAETQMLLPAPPQRYSTDDDEIEQARGNENFEIMEDEMENMQIQQLFDDCDEPEIGRNADDPDLIENENETHEIVMLEDDIQPVPPPEGDDENPKVVLQDDQDKESIISASTVSKKPREPSSSTSRRSSVSSSEEPETKKGKIDSQDNSDTEMMPAETEKDEQEEKDEEDSLEDEEDSEEESADAEELERREQMLHEAARERYNRERMEEREREKQREKKKFAIWMTKDLAAACRSDLCGKMIVLENNTATNIMYRLGCQNDAKNSETYRSVKKNRFDHWVERTRCLQQTAGFRVPNRQQESETEDAQMFKDLHMVNTKERRRQEKEDQVYRKELRHKYRQEKRAKKIAKHARQKIRTQML